MEKQNKSIGKTVLVVLLLIVTIVSLILATYAWAKYTSSFNGTATADVAKWNVTATVNGTAQYTKEFTHVVKTKMAPGTSGIIPVNVKLNDTEVCVKYDIYMESLTGKPTNVKFYEATKSGDAEPYTYTKGTEITAKVSDAATSTTPVISGYLELTNDNTVVDAQGNRYIMWDWPYETPGGDVADTTDGQNANTMSVKVRVVATQVNPNDAAGSDNN